MLAPIRMHPDRAGKSDAPGYATGRDRTDAAPLVATTETFDIAVEKPKGAGLIVDVLAGQSYTRTASVATALPTASRAHRQNVSPTASGQKPG